MTAHHNFVIYFNRLYRTSGCKICWRGEQEEKTVEWPLCITGILKKAKILMFVQCSPVVTLVKLNCKYCFTTGVVKIIYVFFIFQTHQEYRRKLIHCFLLVYTQIGTHSGNVLEIDTIIILFLDLTKTTTHGGISRVC
jgi:hypothetical protein